MGDEVERLKGRYGAGHDYDKLTDPQIKFLLNGGISEHECGGVRTVSIEKIAIENDPLLTVQDLWTYLFHRNMVTMESYAARRMPAYKEITGVEPEDLGNCGYLFTLKDNSQIKVEFVTMKDSE